MSRQTPRSREFTVTVVTGISETLNGNLFLECVTDAGRAAFWGSPANTRNITRLQQHNAPFRVRCGCVEPSKSSFPSHDFWIPQLRQSSSSPE